MRVSIGIFAILCWINGGVWAQVPFPGACPEIKVMDTFDLDAYLGTWFEYSKYPFAFEIGKKCIYAVYGNMDNGSVSVVNAAINRFTGNPSNVTGTAKVIAPAQLAVTFSPYQEASRANYLVLSTDYDSYSVVYSCTNVTQYAHLKVVWILTRERRPTEETVSAAKQVLKDNNITQTLLIDTLQKGCPKVAGENTTMTTDSDSDDDVENFTTTTLPNAIDKA